MKTKWTFHFLTKEIVFEKELKYKGKLRFKGDTSNIKIPLQQDNYSKYILIDINIVPDGKSVREEADQTGCLYLTLPLRHEDAEPLAYDLANRIAHRISFFNRGEFNLHLGLVFSESIPETSEEEKEIGDRPYSGVMHLEEIVEPSKFDSGAFVEKINAPLDNDLITLHNIAKDSSNPIDKFMGFFKIIESYCIFKDKKQQLKKSLEENQKLFKIFHSTFKFQTLEHAKDDFIKFVGAIVHARHHCAHLKENKKFGYVPFDPRIKDEIEPIIYQLEILTYKMIINSSS